MKRSKAMRSKGRNVLKEESKQTDTKPKADDSLVSINIQNMGLKYTGQTKQIVETQKLICENMKLIYAQDRYHEDNSPSQVFIPAKEVLLKMMKACIGVENIYEVWIYDDTDRGLTPIMSAQGSDELGDGIINFDFEEIDDQKQNAAASASRQKRFLEVDAQKRQPTPNHHRGQHA